MSDYVQLPLWKPYDPQVNDYVIWDKGEYGIDKGWVYFKGDVPVHKRGFPDRPRYSMFKYQDEAMRNVVCPDKGANPKVELSDLYQFREKGIKKRGSSNINNVGNINCDSPVWKNKPRCNY